MAGAARRRHHLCVKMAAFTGVHLNRWGAVARMRAASFTVCWSPSITAHERCLSGALKFPSAGWFYRNQAGNQVEHQLLAGSKARAVASARRLFLSSTSISTSSIRRWSCPARECPLRHDRNAGRLLHLAGGKFRRFNAGDFHLRACSGANGALRNAE